ncbi:MAG: hypothetical protein DRO36_06140 [Candidatus Hecatellales archaeon]|nr:MAG: hypothetical protein DRO36_06140 [Candidatus Hecatellales archaeon]
MLNGEQNTLDQYGVGDPAVVKLPKGGYLMVYKTWIESPVKAGTQTQIKMATEEIPVYPVSSTYTVPANLKSAINLAEEIPVES